MGDRMRVLVTGGTGAVGINIVRRLAAEGHEVLCMSRHANEADLLRERFLHPVAQHVRLIAGDVTAFTELRRLYEELRPTGVVHAAAITPTPEMEASMSRTIIEANLMGTVNVLEAARLTGQPRVVYISSAAVYGETDEAMPVAEDCPIRAQGLYPITKHASEKFCSAYQILHGVDTVALRVGWVYGPLERPMEGSRYNMSLVYEFVRLALAGKTICLVHLDHVRDWIHADDVGRAVLTVLEQDRVRAPVYNLSGGIGYSHRAVLETLRGITPLEYHQVQDSEQANVPPHATRRRRGPASTARLQSDTPYRPRLTLEQGLRDYVDWVRTAEWDPETARHYASR
jgi:UDP-glucose 4-epimerase/UDP-glucuronate 4-epimerase